MDRPVPRGIYFLLTGTGGVLLSTHADDRWVANVPDRPGSAVDAGRDLISLPDLAIEVLGDGTWTAVARAAERMAHGPVFLVGDAAHQAPPTGAMGISMAMADVHNLAWKLAAALDGSASATLLDTYRNEREPVVAITVGETCAAWIATRDPAAQPFPGRSLRQLDMGYRYTSRAVMSDDSPDRSGPGDYTPTAKPGCRAPHLWTGVGRSILDLFGRDLVLLTAPDGGRWRAAAPDGVVVHTVPDAGWPDRYGVQPDGAVLIRPDGHVAWRSCGLPGDPAAELRAVTAAAWGHMRAVGI